MLSATILAIFFVPMFFVVVMSLFDRSKTRKAEGDAPPHDDDRPAMGEPGSPSVPQGV
jgi:hypothetical protein